MDVEIRYWPAGEPIPEGWVRHDGLDDTHHGAYATIIVRKNASYNSESDCYAIGGLEIPVANLRQGEPKIVAPMDPLCQCGQPLKTEDRGHHVVTTCCGQVLEGCCGDV